MANFLRWMLLLPVVAIMGAHDIPVGSARGGMAPEERWDPRHLSVLPAQVRATLARYEKACGPLAAEHAFSRWIDGGGTSFLALHFEHLRCLDRKTLCGPTGCLHEVFVASREGYRLILRTHATEIELIIIGARPALRLECGVAACSRPLIWNGRSFV